MKVKKLLAWCAATLALALSPTIAVAAGTSVSVRVEGRAHTLLPAKVVHTHGGWITKAGTPRGECPATSAAGALDVATHHRWGAKHDPSFGLEIVRILGETHTFTSPYFWEIFVNNRPATVGACGLKLHRDERLLFAAAPISGAEQHPLAIRAPRTATAGRAFKVKVVWYPDAGAAKALAGARVFGGGASAITGSNGVANITITRTGEFKLHATHAGYIRAETVRVRVPA